MSESGAKLCPRCDGEYQSWVTQCPDCEIDLVAPAELALRQRDLASADATDAGSAGLAEVEEEQRLAKVPKLAPNQGRLFRAGDQNHTVGIAHSLTAGGIPWRIAPIYGVFVLEEDVEAAETALEEEALHGVPDVLPASAEHDDACPACGFKLRPNETECPECGLAFG